MHELPRAVRRTGKRLGKRANRLAVPIRKRLRRRFQEQGVARQIERAKIDSGCAIGPDFLIIGAPKCATSWLLHALCQHPQVAILQDEVEYFTKRIHLPLDWYTGLFDEASPALSQSNASYRRPFEECRFGEKSASYCALPPRRIRLLRDLRPDARLILLIRDPVQRHWAHTKRFFSKHYFGKKGLDLSVISRAEIFEFFEKTRRFGEYSRMIHNWRGQFGSSQLLILFQEEIFPDPHKAYNQALVHIGVPPVAPDDIDLGVLLGQRKNRGPDVPMPDDVEACLRKMFTPEYARLERMLGRSLPLSWGTR